ncbi:MAG: ABC transporter permease [Gammaproteobacteria bacterium]|nr:MAG: ABC transporter permease [Gammaproteobacteria bacterium]
MQTSSPAQFSLIEGNDNELTFKCAGDWTHDVLLDAEEKLSALSNTYNSRTVVWDVSGVGEIDSAGMMLFIHHYDQLQANQCTLIITGACTDFELLYQLLRQYVIPPVETNRDFRSRLLRPFTTVGKSVSTFIEDVLAFLAFLGESFLAFMYALCHPLSIRYDAIIKNIEDTGVRAMPIIALTSILIGVVITYQGAVQLEKFGAHIFIVDMISISMTRELAPMITAIVVAGRTGSAFTAQIGVMKITEEIDAMRIMGFDPHQYLVVPRITALIIALPLLVIFADLMGLLAGMFISNIHLNLSYSEFIHRLQSALELKHIVIGLIKAPIFAWLIATVACFRGFQVANTTESIGRYTTLSVVNAIFLVIACDAIFSVVLTELGL